MGEKESDRDRESEIEREIKTVLSLKLNNKKNLLSSSTPPPPQKISIIDTCFSSKCTMIQLCFQVICINKGGG